MTWIDGQPEGLSYRQGDDFIRIEALESDYRSKFFNYSGSRTLLFYPENADALTSEERKQLKPVASVAFPEGIKVPLIVIVPGPTGGAPYRSFVVDEDPAVFPFKSYLFVSFSASPVAVSMGPVNFELAPGKIRSVTSDRKNLNMRLAIKPEPSSEWRIIKDDFYPNWPGYRSIVFLIDTVSDGRSHIQVRSLNEPQTSWEAARKPAQD